MNIIQDKNLSVASSSQDLYFVEVSGGTLPKKSKVAIKKVATFQIGKFAVTMEEWVIVRNWAQLNGFDIKPGCADRARHPVTKVNWYDCVKWCNAKSLMEGLETVYGMKGTDGYYCQGEFGSDESDNVIFKPDANGYRLPMEAEWEWAAIGGCNSKGYTYSGSNNLNDVGWCETNAGNWVNEVGKKAPNELGLFDMSGNVYEWCWDYDPCYPSERRARGGSWRRGADYCKVFKCYTNRVPTHDCNMFGLRLARNL